jgi:predicted chitinase
MLLARQLFRSLGKLPTSDRYESNGGYRQNFQGGFITQNAKGVIEVFDNSAKNRSDVLGNPFITALNRVGGTAVIGGKTNEVHVWGQGEVQDFEVSRTNRSIIMKLNGSDKAYVVSGDMFEKYYRAQGPASFLGYPTSDRYEVNGSYRQDFEGGFMTQKGGITEVFNKAGQNRSDVLSGDFSWAQPVYLPPNNPNVMTLPNNNGSTQPSVPTLPSNNTNVNDITPEYIRVGSARDGIQSYWKTNSNQLGKQIGDLTKQNDGSYSQIFDNGAVFWKDGKITVNPINTLPSIIVPPVAPPPTTSVNVNPPNLPANSSLTIYENDNFSGRSQALAAGDYKNLSSLGSNWNDAISSLNISQGWVVEAYEHPDFAGKRVIWNSSTSFVGNEWNDKISSLKVYRADAAATQIYNTGGGSAALAENVIKVTSAPASNVTTYLPHIVNALKEFGIYDRLTLIATVATIAVEVGSFAPIHEYGDAKYFSRYDGRTDLGNTQPGDGARFHGRGFIQLTGRANYRQYGNKLGVDLENNPDLALDPTISARILVAYFVNRGIQFAARAENWKQVRIAVNGGTNGWDTFIGAVNKAKQFITDSLL